MSNTMVEDKIARVSDILEQIQDINQLINSQKENHADPSTVRQYEFIRKEFIEELGEIFRLFNLVIQPVDTAAIPPKVYGSE